MEIVVDRVHIFTNISPKHFTDVPVRVLKIVAAKEISWMYREVKTLPWGE